MKVFIINRGFTLVEAMIAVTIITFAVAGPLFTAGRAIVAAQTARDQLTAVYLAQEGIEYMRAVRDDQYLSAYQTSSATASSVGWANFTSLVTPCSTACTLDPTLGMGIGSGFALAPYSGNAPLYLTNCTSGSGNLVCTPPNIYTQQNLAGSVQTPFTRTVKAAAVSSTDELIVATVSWNFHSIPYSVTTTEHLTPWQ